MLHVLLVPSLQANTSLKLLQLEDCIETDLNGEEGSCELIAALSVALFYSPSIETLHIRGCRLEPSSSQIGYLAQAAASLRELRFCHNEYDLSIADAHCLGQGLISNTKLTSLDLTGCGLDDQAICTLVDSSKGLRNLEHLSLDFNTFGDVGVEALSKGVLRDKDSRLRDLSLFGNRISADGAEELAEALRRNHTLTRLILSFNRIGDEGAAALASALTVNTTLQNLWFPSNSVGPAGIQAFCDNLPKMDGLEQLNVGLLLDDSAANALASAVKDNLRLFVLHMEKAIYDESSGEFDGSSGCRSSSDDTLDFYLRLNRSGRRLLRDRNTVSPALWPHLLAQTQCKEANNYESESRDEVYSAKRNSIPDVLFYFLRQNPDLLESKT